MVAVVVVILFIQLYLKLYKIDTKISMHDAHFSIELKRVPTKLWGSEQIYKFWDSIY